MLGLGGLDWIITIFILVGMWRGFNVGLIQSVVSLVGWLIALLLGSKLAPFLAASFVSVVDSPVLQLALGFLTVVLLVLAVIHVLAFVLKKVLSTLKLSLLDKLAGGVLGAGKHTLVVLVILSISSPVLARLPIWQTSKLAPELLPYAPLAKTLMSEAFGEAKHQLKKVDEMTTPETGVTVIEPQAD